MPYHIKLISRVIFSSDFCQYQQFCWII